MSGQDIIIEQLRADVERLTKLHGRELLERMEAERERDEWKAKHDTLADVSRSCIATAERERDAARAERDARPALATLPTEFVAGEWIMSGQAEPDAVVTYTREPGPETGHVGWCWWARGKMGESRDYMAARGAAEHSLIAAAMEDSDD